jgi:hypothetical protein
MHIYDCSGTKADDQYAKTTKKVVEHKWLDKHIWNGCILVEQKSSAYGNSSF